MKRVVLLQTGQHNIRLFLSRVGGFRCGMSGLALAWTVLLVLALTVVSPIVSYSECHGQCVQHRAVTQQCTGFDGVIHVSGSGLL